jgi:hypothetical protein
VPHPRSNKNRHNMKQLTIQARQTVSLQVDTGLVGELQQFSDFTGFPLQRIADEAIALWLQTVAIDYVYALAQESHCEIPKLQSTKVIEWPGQ